LIFEIKENQNFEFIEVRKNIPPYDDPNLLEIMIMHLQGVLI